MLKTITNFMHNTFTDKGGLILMSAAQVNLILTLFILSGLFAPFHAQLANTMPYLLNV